MIIIDLLLLILLYFIVGYFMLVLYKKGMSIFVMRVILIFGLIFYIGFFHHFGDEWGSCEKAVITVIFLAHILIINPYDKNLSENISDDSNFSNYPQTNNNYSSSSFGRILFLSWLFDAFSDDDNDLHQ